MSAKDEFIHDNLELESDGLGEGRPPTPLPLGTFLAEPPQKPKEEVDDGASIWAGVLALPRGDTGG